MSEWRIDAPPKESVFLADVGLPWSVPCTWNGANQEFVIAVLQCGLYEGEWNDWSWENEWYPAESIKRWMPMPELT